MTAWAEIARLVGLIEVMAPSRNNSQTVEWGQSRLTPLEPPYSSLWRARRWSTRHAHLSLINGSGLAAGLRSRHTAVQGSNIVALSAKKKNPFCAHKNTHSPLWATISVFVAQCLFWQIGGLAQSLAGVGGIMLICIHKCIILRINPLNRIHVRKVHSCKTTDKSKLYIYLCSNFTLVSV